MNSWQGGLDGRVGQKRGDRRQETGEGIPMNRDGRFGCSFVLHIKNPLFVRCVLYTMGSWVSSEFFTKRGEYIVLCISYFVGEGTKGTADYADFEDLGHEGTKAPRKSDTD